MTTPDEKKTAVSSVLVAVVLVIIIVVGALSLILLQQMGNSTRTSSTSANSLTISQSTSSSLPIVQISSSSNSTFTSSVLSPSSSYSASGRILLSFAYPGTLVSSPDLSSMNYSVTLNALGNVPSNLSLSASGPSELVTSISPASVSFSSGAPAATLKISSPADAEPGTYQITIAAIGSGQIFSQNETVQVVKYLVVTIAATFVPQNLTVSDGSSVTWIRLNGVLSQYDNGAHDVDFSSGTSAVSPTLNQYDSWSYTFSHPGNYSYFCKYHPFMKGSIMVVL